MSGEKYVEREREETSSGEIEVAPPLEDHSKTRWQRAQPVIACGAGLFSDGYLQSVIGAVRTTLAMQYPYHWTHDPNAKNISAIAFAGTVVGQLAFGYTSDRYSRKWSLLVSTILLIVFAALAAGSWGNPQPQGIFQALVAWRFLVGIGIGGEYPAGSVGCAEASGEMKYGHRNRWFIWFTNVQIDFGFVMGSFLPMLIALGQPGNYTLIWRLSLALGVIPPLSLLYLRILLKEPASFTREKFNKKTPYWLAFKFYGFRLLIVSTIWFIYDFLTYPFSIFSSAWVAAITPNPTLWQSFGWSTLINLFYVPGAIIGANVSDWLGPRLALSIFVAVQGAVGFIMAGTYGYLKEPANIGGFVVVYGVFLALGEIGPGDNIGLVASKSCSTGIRGKYYAIAAAMGKIGAFIGNYIFPYIIADGGGEATTTGGQYPFYLASSLCFFSAAIVWFLPHIGQDTIENEDRLFRAYLLKNGFDITTMGTEEWQDKRRQASVNGQDLAPPIEAVPVSKKTTLF